MKYKIFFFISSGLLFTTTTFAEEIKRDPAAASYSIPVTPSEKEKTEANSESLGNISGDWNGKRKKLADEGLEFQMVYKLDTSRNFSGGLQQKNSVLGNLDVRVLVDAEKKWGWGGTSFMLYGLGNHVKPGSATSNHVGDLQTTDNIEAKVDDFKLYEAYVQKYFNDNKLSLLFGLHDLNTEFYVTESSLTLLNNSFGTGKDLSQNKNGPSIFPFTAPSLRLRYQPSTTSYTQVAIFNALAGNPNDPKGLHIDSNSSEGFLYILETGCTPSKNNKNSKYAIGAWTYSKKFDSIDGATQADSTGAYLLVDHAVTDKLSVFLRYGFANTKVHATASNQALGLQIKSPAESRKNDKLLFALTQISSGSEYIDSQLPTKIANTETAWELTYKAEAMRGLFIQPDLQYVTNPSFSNTVDSAFVGTIRFEFNF